MTDEALHFVTRVATQGLFVAVLVSSPPILLSMVIGLLVSIIQAVTQVQEQNLTFVPKMIMIFGSLAIMAGWIGNTMLQFAKLCFTGFADVIH